jgi:hypothetical protein
MSETDQPSQHQKSITHKITFNHDKLANGAETIAKF